MHHWLKPKTKKPSTLDTIQWILRWRHCFIHGNDKCFLYSASLVIGSANLTTKTLAFHLPIFTSPLKTLVRDLGADDRCLWDRQRSKDYNYCQLLFIKRGGIKTCERNDGGRVFCRPGTIFWQKCLVWPVDAAGEGLRQYGTERVVLSEVFRLMLILNIRSKFIQILIGSRWKDWSNSGEWENGRDPVATRTRGTSYGFRTVKAQMSTFTEQITDTVEAGARNPRGMLSKWNFWL